MYLIKPRIRHCYESNTWKRWENIWKYL